MLQARELRKAFNGILAIDGVSVSVLPGEVVGLAGPNGSGKSTLIELLCGRLAPDSGAILVDGNVVSQRTLRASAAGRTTFRTYQIPRIFPRHTVAENILLGAWAIPDGSSGLGYQAPSLAVNAHAQNAGTLSVGERRRLILSWLYARLGRVRFFLLDEPSAGGDEAYIKDLLEFIRAARARSSGVLVVEHNRALLNKLADRVVYMERGRICDEPPETSRSQIGAAVHSGAASGPGLTGRSLVIARNGATVVKGVSIAAGPGDIVGLMGPNGCGKSTLLLGLYGDHGCQIVGGSVTDDGVDLSNASVRDRIRRGIHFLPQEVMTFQSLTVEETLRVSLEACEVSIDPAILLTAGGQVPHVRELWKRRCGELSGGERRLVGLARIIALEPRYVLLDEPSAGLDHEARKVVADLIEKLASKGAGIIMAEQDESFVSAVCSNVVRLTANGAAAGS